MSRHADPAIVVQGLVFDYPAHRALRGVSFTVARGNVTALVGPNGAGKTTLLSCLAALLRPVAGTVIVDGVDVLDDPRAGHRAIGYLKDFYGLYASLTVHQTLWHAARAHGIPSAACPAALERVASELGLEALMRARAGALSRGQRQRLAIARALVHRPPVLLLDEPASGLDPQARHELAELMRALQQGGVTLLVSSHILAELAGYSSEMLIIRDGRLLEQRPLTDASGVERLRMEFCTAPSAVPGALADHPGVSEAHVERGAVSFLFRGGARQRHALLRACLDAGLDVSSLARVEAALQDEYLQRMRESERPGAGP